MHVANPPPKPLMIWDGNCHFCVRWIERWRIETGDSVDYERSQDVAQRFPEIAPADFDNAVVLVEPDGNVATGADAVFRALSYGPRKWPRKFYDSVPGFAAFTGFAYKIVARNRMIASRATRLLWGDDVRPPTYFAARRWFLRLLGVVYFIAFVSLWMQVDGLVGDNGILPIGHYLQAAHAQLG